MGMSFWRKIEPYQMLSLTVGNVYACRCIGLIWGAVHFPLEEGKVVFSPVFSVGLGHIFTTIHDTSSHSIWIVLNRHGESWAE